MWFDRLTTLRELEGRIISFIDQPDVIKKSCNTWVSGKTLMFRLVEILKSERSLLSFFLSIGLNAHYPKAEEMFMPATHLGRLDYAVQMARAVDNSVNLNGSPANFVESEITANNKDSVSRLFQPEMSGDNPEIRMGGELADPSV